MASERRRVLAPQALGGDEYLRATWHESKQVVVFSQWTGDACTAAIPVRVDQLGDLAGLLVDALGNQVKSVPTAWAPPLPDARVSDDQISA